MRPAASRKSEIRNFEIRNKFKIRNANAQNEPDYDEREICEA